MSVNNTIIFYRRIMKWAGKTVTDYIVYGDILFLLIASVWLYVFVNRYYFEPKEDFSFIASKREEVYDVTIDRVEFHDVYAKHRSKQISGVAASFFIQSPF